jgi:capsular polysaccharide transport system permease protein
MDALVSPLERERAEAPKPAIPRAWAPLAPAARLAGPWRSLLLIVAFPVLVVAAYLYLVAADQYVSEAHFIVRTGQTLPSSGSSLGALLGLDGAGSQSEARSVEDYLLSHDALQALDRKLGLVALFRRPEADIVSRLHGGPIPPPETLLRYYRHQVQVTHQSDSGIATLRVRAFRPQDAQRIAETLLQLGEERVNTFNQRALENSLSVASSQLRDAELAVARAQQSVTGFRQKARDIDPQRTSSAEIELAAGLQGRLAQERAALDSMGGIASDSPQRAALAAQVRALEAQLGGVRAHLAGTSDAMASGLGSYESLRLRQEFAAKRYEAAAATLEAARTEALKQQLFVVRVVEPNLPVKALYPERLKVLAVLLVGLLLSYAIGALILAGVREHAG